MQRTNFENLRVYQLTEQLADAIWDMVVQWGFFARDTVGKQLVKSVDSIGANMAEGTGRGSSGDNKRFAKIARGSMFEVKHWLRRAYKRKLINEDQTQCLKVLIDELSPKLSAYINSIGLK
ncbi:MAG: four helix bundle protein [Calditrichia bacterium]